MVQVRQEECPLLLTEDLPLFRIDSERIKKDRSYWKQDHSDSILLLMSNKRIDWKKIFFEEILGKMMTDIGQTNIEKITRRYGEEKAVRMIKKIMKNNEIILKLQKQIGKLQIMKKEEEKRQREREIRKREEKKVREQEETDRQIEECRKRNEKEREEREEQRRVDEE